MTTVVPTAREHPRHRAPVRRSAKLVAAAGVAVLLLAVAAWWVDANRRPDPTAGFLRAQGTQLLLDGEPYRFVGYNSYVMLGCGLPQERLDDEARSDFFRGLRPQSVVRVFLLPGTDLALFDRVVADARDHGHRLVPVLTDALGGCGDTEKAADWYSSGFRGSYLDWVRTAVPRYRDEPAVGIWELVNEPHDVGPDVLKSFYDEVGGLVHALAPRQLVSSGTLQPVNYGGQSGFRLVSSSTGIDVLSLHEYDEVPHRSSHAEPALDVARELDKPLMVGEWGIAAGADGSCRDLEERRDVARAKLEDYLSTPEVAGIMYWSYKATATACTYDVTAGDPLQALLSDIDIPLPEDRAAGAAGVRPPTSS